MGAHDFVVVLELLPPLRLEDSGSVEQAQTWLQLIELLSNNGLPLPALQSLFYTIEIFEHPAGLLDGDLRVPKDPLFS